MPNVPAFRSFWLLAGLMLVAKLLLVAGNEIVAEGHDAWSYVLAASMNPVSDIGGKLPGYPTWLWLWKEAGVPQRLAIEGFFVFSASVLAWSLRRSVLGPLAAASVLLITVFSPVSYFLFDRALSDGFYLCLVALAVALSIVSLEPPPEGRRWVVFAALGLVLGLLVLTRPEAPLVAAMWLALLLVTVLLRMRSGSRAKAALRAALPGLVTSAIVAVALNGLVVLVHAAKHGVFATTLVSMPSHSRLLNNLAAIKVSQPQQRYFPISREARMRAYQNSPALNTLKPWIESPDNIYQRASAELHGFPGEIGAGWIWHVFNDAAGRTGIHKPVDLDRFYQQVNRELEAAFEYGRLERKFVWHPLLGQDAGTWLPHLVEGISNMAAAMSWLASQQADAGFDEDLFDRICLRRRGLIRSPSGEIKGWAFAPGRKVLEVIAEVGPEAEPRRRWVANRLARPDVEKAYGLTIPQPGFAARVSPVEADPLRLRFVLDNGEVAVADALVRGKVGTATSARQSTQVTFGLDVVPSASPAMRDDPATNFMERMVKLYNTRWLWWSGVFALVAATALATRSALRGGRRDQLLLAVFALALAWILSRLGFYAVIDAGAWGADPRYVYASGYLLTALFVVALSRIAEQVLPVLRRVRR